VKRVLTAVILIPIVVLALFRAPLWLFALLVLGVALLAAREYFDIAEKTGFRPMRGLGYFFLVCIFASMYNEVSDLGFSLSIAHGYWIAILGRILFYLALASPLVLLVAGLRRDSLSQSLGDAAVSLLMIPYIGLTLLVFALMRESEFGAFFLLYLMLVVWSGDIAAYYVGRAIGNNKLAPRISPGKTWEGATASAIFAIVIALLLFHYSRPIFHNLALIGLFHSNLLQNGPAIEGTDVHPWLTHPPAWLVICFGLCVNIAAQLGDLFESAIKRGGGVKDSGTLLPGHGGVLDRIDALLFALPAGFFFYTFMH
jgi:phosphatidate cytidylyltransferase